MNDLHRGSFSRSLASSENLLWMGRLWYRLKACYRHLRVGKAVTNWLGPQYRRSRSLLEIDITYLCNLRCMNCNRSCTQAPEALHLEVDQLRRWVEEWMQRQQKWQRIRVLGGEPTLHPAFDAIIAELERYRLWNPGCRIEVVSNGYGSRVKGALSRLPAHILVENTKKTSSFQPSFGPFNLAPCDDHRYQEADYRNGCATMEKSGMGLTPFGYYPCAVAGGIDRIQQRQNGAATLPLSDDDMLSAVKAACAVCGRFREGHHVPTPLRPRLEEEKISPTWSALYHGWRQRRGEVPPG